MQEMVDEADKAQWSLQLSYEVSCIFTNNVTHTYHPVRNSQVHRSLLLDMQPENAQNLVTHFPVSARIRSIPPAFPFDSHHYPSSLLAIV